MNEKMIFEPPKLESTFHRCLDSMGLHDAETISIKDAFRIVEIISGYEHRHNEALQKLIGELQDFTIKPIVIERTK